MSFPVTLDGTGRIVLPSEVRRRLSLRPGSKLNLEVVAEGIHLTPQAEPDAAFGTSASKRRVLKSTGKRFDAAAATRAEREALARSRRTA